MIGFLISLVVGGLIGFVAEQIMNRDVPGGIIGNIVLGFLGAWVGGLIIPDFGWVVADFAVFPAIIGALIVVFIYSLIAGKTR